MKKKIIQSKLTKNNNLSKTKETEKVLEKIVAALKDHSIEDIGEFFSSTFNWFGNYGCGTKKGLREFQNNWQVPFQEAFSNKVCVDEARLFMGEWAAAFGKQEAIHTGEFMGIKPTGKKVEIRYMDFLKLSEGKIKYNWVKVDIPFVMKQLGVDIFNGMGWEKFDNK